MIRKIMISAMTVFSLGAMAEQGVKLWHGCAFEVEQDKIVQGESAVLRVISADNKPVPALKITFLDHELFQGQVPGQENTAYYFLPVDYHTKPGAYTLRIEAKDNGDIRNMPIRVMAGTYPKETLSVDPKFTKLPPEVLARTEREAKMIAALYERYQPFDHELRTLVYPLQSSITSPFGIKRLFNREVKSYHNGVDFRAQVGTPIMAPADGKIIFADNLFYSGNHIAIDHGAGVVTTYSHLSKMLVKAGDEVKAGDVIGLAGSTGRVTGPHLHWVVKLNTVTVNPIQAKALLQSIR
jgi:murein DD-endopeptidase MepM/ murein hydrolase activator NlpD